MVVAVSYSRAYRVFFQRKINEVVVFRRLGCGRYGRFCVSVVFRLFPGLVLLIGRNSTFDPVHGIVVSASDQSKVFAKGGLFLCFSWYTGVSPSRDVATLKADCLSLFRAREAFAIALLASLS